MSTSIYLAKSNRANPDIVMAVRNILSRFDVTIVEFKGGAYSHKPLLECEMLVVVPDLSDDESNEEWVNVGKGLFNQVQAFILENKKCDLLVVNYYHEGTKELGLGEFDDFDIADEDDFVNYGSLCFKDNDLGTLSQVLENRLDPKKVNSTDSSKRTRYRLLLTKK
jgi:hypothetical protein